MAIEDTLNSIDHSLKLIVTILQSAGAISAQPGPDSAPAETTKPAVKATKATKAKDTSTNPDPASLMGLVEGDAEGTRYWVSEELSTVYTQKPGDPDPQPASFKIETAAHYTTKKAEFAKKSSQATGAQTTEAAKVPAATTPAASTASSAPVWKDVLTAIQELNKSDKPGHGRDGVMAVLKQFGLEGQKVPALEALGKHADILKFTRELIDDATAAADDLGI